MKKFIKELLMFVGVTLLVGCGTENEKEIGILVYKGDENSYISVYNSDGYEVDHRKIYDSGRRVSSRTVVDTFYIEVPEDCDYLNIVSTYLFREVDNPEEGEVY